MSTVAAIGEHERLRGFALAGVRVAAAQDPNRRVRPGADWPTTSGW